ncbi:MAG: DUF503 domain-containing protein [Tissierellia bacterium]|nr:DUF503 domain-containing protein [Tissierellia bacterium]
MIVGIYLFQLRLFHSYSLKDKRAIRMSILSNLRRIYKVSAAEVDAQQMHNFLVIGASLVSSDALILRKTYDEILRYMDERCDVELINATMELV